MVGKRGSKGSKQKRGGAAGRAAGQPGEMGGESNYIPPASPSRALLAVSERPLTQFPGGDPRDVVHWGPRSAPVAPASGSLERTTTTRSGLASTKDVVMVWFVVVIIIGGLIALVWWSVKYQNKRRRALEKVLDPNAETTEEERHLAADAMMYPSGGYGYGYGGYGY